MVFWFVLIAASKYGYEYFGNSNDSELDAGMRYVADKVNRSAPRGVHDGTRFDSAVGSSEMFTYNYTLVNYSYGQIKPQEIQKKHEKRLRRLVCRSKTMEPMRKLGVPISYTYHSNDGKEITSILISTRKC